MSCLSPLTFDAVPFPIAHVSLDGVVRRANRAFAALAGRAERDLMSVPVESLFTPALTPDEARALRDVVRGETAEAELRKCVLRADAPPLPITLRYTVLRSVDGRAHCGVVMLDPPDEPGRREDLDRVAKVVSGETGEPFFRSLLVEMTTALGTDFAFIAELDQGDPPSVSRTVAAIDRGQAISNFEYRLAGTPCEQLVEGGMCAFPSGVQAIFPEDEGLRRLGIEAYVGVRLHNSRQKAFGLVVMLDRKPLADVGRVQSMLRIFAPRVAAELERIQVEQELRRSERYLSEAQRIAHLGNWIYDPDDDRIFASEEAVRICGLGQAPRAIAARDFFRVVHADDRAEVRHVLGRAARDGRSVEIAFHVGEAAGDPLRVVELRAEPVVPADRDRRRMCGTIQDVTDRQSATEELRKLSMAIEQAADQIVITDSLGTIEYVNRAFETMTGYTSAEAIGGNPRILKSGLQAPAFYRELWDTLTRGEVFRGVFINRKKNGEVYYEEKTVTPIRNPKGEIAHYVATGTDITERRLAAEGEARLHDALRAAATEWRITFDSMPTAIVVVESDGSIRRLNHAASSLLRGRPADVVGQPLERFGDREPWATALSLLRAIAAGRTVPAVEIGADGTTWEISLTTAGAQSGNQVILVIRDITRTVALRESLRKSETMSAMGALVAGVAHEARNPLFGISATLDAFEKSLGASGCDHGKYMGVLRRELGRLNLLMHELLEYGRPLDLDLGENALATIVERTLESCELMASEKGVLLESTVGPGTKLWCDGSKVEQAVRNLVENAIQHSPAGRRVVVREASDPKGRLAGCEVLDEGPGFDARDLAQIFEPFHSRRRGGTGLGLAIVERVIEQHQGRVRASNREGGGACVSILLPIAEAGS